MAGSQVAVVAVQVEKQRAGYQGVSLTHMSDGVEPQITAGSKVEVDSALYEFTALESITGGAGIPNSTAINIRLTVGGGGASVTASWTTTAPAWDDAKQGYYIGADRVIGGAYKDSGGNYVGKWLYMGGQSQQGPGLVPVGAIIAWHKSLAGCPPLPSNFVECNGQVLADGSSPFNGQTIPNLNGSGWFIRGSSTSGTVQGSATKLPNNPFSGTASIGQIIGGLGVIMRAANGGSNGPGVIVDINSGGDAETRPPNISMVWVMRIK